jgi:hypothetical protein
MLERMQGKKKPSYTAGGNVSWYNPSENILEAP